MLPGWRNPVPRETGNLVPFGSLGSKQLFAQLTRMSSIKLDSLADARKQMVTLQWFRPLTPMCDILPLAKVPLLTSFATAGESPSPGVCPVGVVRPIIRPSRGRDSGSNKWLRAFDILRNPLDFWYPKNL